MQNENVLIYIIKRGMPPYVASFDYAVPVNTDIQSQRLQCSGRTVSKFEVVFPIRVKEDERPTATLRDSSGKVLQELEFELIRTNPSRAIFVSEVSIKMDGIKLDFNLTRDCNVILHMKD